MITKDRKFYKLIFAIAIPVACQNLLAFAVSMSDSVLVGKMGQDPLVAVSLANQLFFVFMILMFGLGSAGNIFIAQYWGKGDTKAIHKVMSIMLMSSIAFSILFMGVAIFIPKQFMGIFTENPVIIELGTEYLQTIFISYIFFAVTNILINVLRSVETVKISVIVYTVSLIVNVFLNWVLIFGNLGAPVLGVRGSAIATTIARITEFLIVLVFIIFFENKIKFKVRKLFKTDRILLKDFTKVGGPVVLNELLWALGSSAIALIVAKMGEEVVAANNINNVVWQFVAVFIMGVGNAGAVIIGNTIGAAEYKKAKEYANTLVVLAIGLGIAGGLIMLAIRPYVLMLYKVPELTKEITMQIMGVSSGILVFQSLAFILMIGILRGGGDTKFVLIADIIFLLFVAIPLGYLVAIVLKWPIPIVFIALRCDEILKVIISLFRVKNGKWIRNVTR